MGNELNLVTTGISLFVIIAISYGLYRLKKANPDRNLGDSINYLFLHDTSTIAAIGLIAVNVFEGMMAATIPSPPGEVDIQPIARFGNHMFISLVGIVFGLAGIGALVMVKHAKANKGQIICAAIACLIFAFIIPFANLMLIAQGLGQIPELMYIVNFRFVEGFSHMTYPMASSTVAWILHYVMLAGDAGLALKNDSHVILKIFTKSSNIEASEIDKNITEKGKQKEEEEKNKPDNIINRMLKRYRFQNDADFERMLALSIKAKDGIADAGTKATLAYKLVELDKEVAKMDASKGKASKEERTAINQKVYEKIANFWSGSITNGNGFGINLPKKHGGNQ